LTVHHFFYWLEDHPKAADKIIKTTRARMFAVARNQKATAKAPMAINKVRKFSLLITPPPPILNTISKKLQGFNFKPHPPLSLSKEREGNGV
jgi:hypothetical protein